MTGCESSETLGAYHDGELDAAAHARVSDHIGHCAVCSEELARLEALSQAMAPIETSLRLLPVEQSRIQAGVRKGVASVDLQSSLYRVAAAMGLVAASILIVSGAWLMELSDRPQSALAAAPHTAPEWERIATTLNAQPRPVPVGESPYFLRYAMSVERTLQSHVPAEGEP